MQRQDFEGARIRIEQSLAEAEGVVADDFIGRAPPLMHLGECLERLGRFEEARSRYRRAAEIFERASGTDDRRTADAEVQQCRVLARLGDPQETVVACDRALQHLHEVVDRDDAMLLIPLVELGRVHLSANGCAAAIDEFERAAKLAPSAQTDRETQRFVGFAHLGWAACLAQNPQTRTKALEQADAGRAPFEDDPRPPPGDPSRLTKWVIATHP
jgi:tetratricopeptide (TPR) repeat protein